MGEAAVVEALGDRVSETKPWPAPAGNIAQRTRKELCANCTGSFAQSALFSLVLGQPRCLFDREQREIVRRLRLATVTVQLKQRIRDPAHATRGDGAARHGNFDA